MAEHILEMRNITKTFPGVKALQQVNLSVEPAARAGRYSPFSTSSWV